MNDGFQKYVDKNVKKDKKIRQGTILWLIEKISLNRSHSHCNFSITQGGGTVFALGESRI